MPTRWRLTLCIALVGALLLVPGFVLYRTDPSRTDGGVSLGLSIAHQIAEARGG